MWLFQEAERLSADRIFPVKLKQPFASTQTSSEVFVIDDDTSNDSADEQEKLVEIG